MARLIVVSNRVAIPDKEVPAGGLAVGVLSALSGPDGGIWFGWSGKTRDNPSREPEIVDQGGIRFATVDLPAAHFDAYYTGFCNGSLWPLHHYFPGSFRYEAAEFAAYLEINRHFAEVLVGFVRPGDLVWIHDYQLIPLGGLLREAGIAVRIGFFLHIPYPTIAVLRLMPPYAELVRAMCAYDLVGFQTDEDLSGFESAVKAVYGADAAFDGGVIRTAGRSTRTGVFPIGVDVDEVQRQAESAVRDDAQVIRLAAGLTGRRLLLGVDRLDYSKGLIERFASYQALLDGSPDLHGAITYLQIAPLSRVDVPAYADLRESLERAAGHINGLFADTDWTPIRYLNREFAHGTLSGFLRITDVAVVTPVRDGMNLVAKEFVAAQDADDPGVLVLSSLAGAAQELGGALLVNPYDKAAVAAALRRGLEMGLAERRERHRGMLDALRQNTIARWHESFVAQLVA